MDALLHQQGYKLKNENEWAVYTTQQQLTLPTRPTIIVIASRRYLYIKMQPE